MNSFNHSKDHWLGFQDAGANPRLCHQQDHLRERKECEYSKKCYTVINASPLQHLIDRPSFNALEAVLSTLYFTMKYILSNKQVGLIKGNQELARKCYRDGMKLKKKNNTQSIQSTVTHKVHFVDLGPHRDPLQDTLIPMEKLSIIHIGTKENYTTQIGTVLLQDKEAEIVQLLRKNVGLFARHLRGIGGKVFLASC